MLANKILTKIEYYRLDDGRIWDIEKAEFVDEAPEDTQFGTLSRAHGPIDEAYLAETLRFYGYPLGCLATSAEKFMMLRDERDRRISATDYLLMPDYPISAEKKTQVEEYRTALRDLPAKAGAPWDGGGELTPWPEAPEI